MQGAVPGEEPGMQCQGIVAVLGLAEVRTCGGYADHDRATAAIFAPQGLTQRLTTPWPADA